MEKPKTGRVIAVKKSGQSCTILVTFKPGFVKFDHFLSFFVLDMNENATKWFPTRRS